MLSEMTSKQLSEWMAFFRLEPFGYEANVYGHAITASTIANVNRKKGKKAFRVEDFMPRPRETPSTKSFFINLKTLLTLNNRKKEEK